MSLTTRQTQIHSRQFWSEFFSLYESLPVLWDMQSGIYKERVAKVEAYDKLVEKLKEVEPLADRDDVLRKLNIFRTNFRRERSRIQQLTMANKSYRSTLWYYDMLKFLQSQDKPKVSKRSNNNGSEKNVLRKKAKWGAAIALKQSCGLRRHSEDETQHSQYTTQNEDAHVDELSYENDGSDINYDDIKTDYFEEPKTNQSFENEFGGYSEPETISPKIEITEDTTEYDLPQCKERNSQTTEDPMMHELLDDELRVEESSRLKLTLRQLKNMQCESKSRSATTQHLNSISKPKKNSSCSHDGRTSEAAAILAKSWAIQYDEMSVDQKIYARKAIADILFDGCMGNLGKNTSI